VISRAPRRRLPFEPTQHEIDEEWFEKNPGRRLRARWAATHDEGVELSHVRLKGRGWRDLAIVARAWDGSHFVWPFWTSAEFVHSTLSRGDDELLAQMSEEGRRFFQRMIAPAYGDYAQADSPAATDANTGF